MAQFRGDSFASAKVQKTANIEYVYVIIDGFASQNENGQAKGLLFDLMGEFEAYVADKYGIQIKSNTTLIENSDFKKFLDVVGKGTGGVFGLSTTTINAERKKFLKFSSAYLNNISVLISHNSIATLSSMNSISTEFAGISAYSAPGTTYGKRVEAVKTKFYPDLKVNSVPSEFDIVENVLSDNASFGFVDIGTYLGRVTRREPIKRHPAGDQTGEQFGIIMPPTSDWEPVLNEFFSSFLKSSKYRQIVTENVGKGGLRMIAQ
ncbi:MAG: transporter substrate-binding domain-containing protein [Cyclobacteriaceae bacterium]